MTILWSFHSWKSLWRGSKEEGKENYALICVVLLLINTESCKNVHTISRTLEKCGAWNNGQNAANTLVSCKPNIKCLNIFYPAWNIKHLKIYFVLDIIIENKQSPGTVTGVWLDFFIFLEQKDWCKHPVQLSNRNRFYHMMQVDNHSMRAVSPCLSMRRL